MKKVILCLIPIVVAACSTPPQTSSVPMDMKTVEQYNQRVASGKTVDPKQKNEEWKLNASDNKTNIYIYSPRIYPRVGYGYYY